MGSNLSGLERILYVSAILSGLIDFDRFDRFEQSIMHRIRSDTLCTFTVSAFLMSVCFDFFSVI